MTTVYSLRPIIRHDVQVNYPSCVYRVKNIHDNGDTRQDDRITDVTEQVINFLKSPLPEVAALEAKQEKILAQLAELKEQVLGLCDVLKENSWTEGKISPAAGKDPVRAELVLNVPTSSPCYSVLALRTVWSDVGFRLRPYVHSSVRGKVPEGFAASGGAVGDRLVDLALIWKNVDDVELTNSITGEVNFLRYLARLLGDYDALPDVTRIDRILDLSHQLIHRDQKDRQSTLSLLDQKLGGENWLSGKRPGIADAAAWSAVKRISPRSLPAGLSAWLQRCEDRFTK